MKKDMFLANFLTCAAYSEVISKGIVVLMMGMVICPYFS